MRDYYIGVFNEPKVIKEYPEALEYSCIYFDPTICAQQDVENHEGKIVIKKGESFNPLKQISFKQEWLFFDATSEKHIMWAKTQKKMPNGF